MASFSLDASQLKRLLASENGPVYALTRNITQDVYNHAQRFVPVDSGNLAESIGQEMRLENNQIIGRVGFNAVHGIYVHEGTGENGPRGVPYTIRPRTKKALAFEWKGAPANAPRLPDGRVVYRKVTHRGIKPNPFLTKALDAVKL